jgi:energy-coupling factor transporter ATP-binding protein EcfA2
MVKLKRLKIEKYRNVKPGTELHFRDSLNVMLGRNGTGKTTLLGLVTHVLSGNFESIWRESFELEYQLQIPEALLTIRLQNNLSAEMPDAVRESDAGMYEDARMLSSGGASAEILVDVAESKYRLRLSGSKVFLKEASAADEEELDNPFGIHGWVSFSMLATLCSQTERVEGIGAVVRALKSASGGDIPLLRRFDESLGYLDSVVQASDFFTAVRMSSNRGYRVLARARPKVVTRRLSTALRDDPDVDEVKIRDDEEGADFLARLVRLLECKSAEMRIQRTERQTQPFDSVKFSGIRFDFVRHDDSVINHSLLSYGQKRLLAFYYYLASNPDCVVADELVNGMHHEWIGACLEDLGERQAFLTSQNPLLLDYLYFESAEEVRSSFVLCRTEIHEGREQLVWENMSLDEAEGFFSAYQVAIHHVGELLRLRGLW